MPSLAPSPRAVVHSLPSRRKPSQALGLLAAACVALAVASVQSYGVLGVGASLLYAIPLGMVVRLAGRTAAFVSVPLLATVAAVAAEPGQALEALLGHAVGLLCLLAVLEVGEESLLRARRAALRDPLTGLLNRRGLVAATRRRRREEQAAIVVLDCDGFKQVNDRHGHAAGDEALRLVARALNAEVGINGVVGRTGGDEFLAYLPEATPTEAEACVGRVRSRLARALESRDFHIDLSHGIAQLAPAEPLEPAVEAADRRLYNRRRILREAA